MEKHCDACGVKLPEGYKDTNCEDCGPDATAGTYNVTLNVDVHSVNSLLRAAMDHATNTDGLSEEEARDVLVPDGDVDIGACLQMLLDPGVSPDGTSINCSSCESE